MAAQTDTLEVMEVGAYSELASRPNPHANEIVFIPSLSALLAEKEIKLGRPLTETEVKVVRDAATVTVTPTSDHSADSSVRAYDDINPNNAWQEWQRLRKSIPKP
ncbi:hypothetical protein [Collimonas humicola]|uniref:hypothetical protein n=1 Tax=Collimonas humicola TaxID=2825886 RepID=UPI001B8D92D4|nr:hypothetical protein [Collimonas humicola]